MFNMMPSSDVVIWITMLLGHVKCGDLGQKALELLQQMQHELHGEHHALITHVHT